MTPAGFKQCPYCAEEIRAEATKCRYCGENVMQAPAPAGTKPKAKDHDSYRSFTLLAAILPIIGVIVGIAYMIKPGKLDKKLGEHTLAASILFAIIWYAAVALLGVGSVPSTITRQAQPAAVVTMAEYNRIEEGMSLREVQRIIGANGTESSRTTIAGMTTLMQEWSNPGGSNMNAMFQDDKLISKAQFGLR